MRLTEQQLRLMDTFGFIKFPGLFADDIDRITNAFEKLWASHGAGHHGEEHDRKRRSALVPFIDQDEYLASLIDDPRIDGVIGSLLGDDYNYSGSDGNFYVGNTPWHSDGYMPYPGYVSVKMAFLPRPGHARHGLSACHSQQPQAGRRLRREPAGDAGQLQGEPLRAALGARRVQRPGGGPGVGARRPAHVQPPHQA